MESKLFDDLSSFEKNDFALFSPLDILVLFRAAWQLSEGLGKKAEDDLLWNRGICPIHREGRCLNISVSLSSQSLGRGSPSTSRLLGQTQLF